MKYKLPPPPVPSYYHTSIHKLYIDKSHIPKAGFGVFTTSIIPFNTYIDEYQGVRSKYTKGTYSFEIDNENIIDAFDYPRCYMAMINDARGSNFCYNCEFRVIDNKVEIWSIIEICSGSELYINYGNDYWH